MFFTASDATDFARGLMQPQLSLNEKKNSEEAGTPRSSAATQAVLTSSEKLRKVRAVLARGHATGKWRPEGSSLDTDNSFLFLPCPKMPSKLEYVLGFSLSQ